METQDIIDGISRQISHHLNRAQMECTNPQEMADRMDATIKFHFDKAKALKGIREQLENCFATVMPREV